MIKDLGKVVKDFGKFAVIGAVSAATAVLPATAHADHTSEHATDRIFADVKRVQELAGNKQPLSYWSNVPVRYFTREEMGEFVKVISNITGEDYGIEVRDGGPNDWVLKFEYRPLLKKEIQK